MPLPTHPKQPWPPKSWADIQRDYREADAWYSGDEAKLITFYGGPTQSPTAQQSGWSRFWTRRSADQSTGRQRIHVPAASDVAATSSDLLFGDEVRLVIPEAHEAEGNTDAAAAEDRLTQLAEMDAWASTFLEGAEIASGIGDVYLRPVWNRELADHPWLDVVHGDHALPEWRTGRLTAVTFWSEVLRDEKGIVWRHLERYEPGVILHGLYAGDAQHLGIQRPLTDNPATAALIGPDAADENGVVLLPKEIRGLAVRHIPNVRPNRRHRGRPIGRADTAGTEHLMDALDETWSSWMRDIRLGKGRIIVPEQFLEKRGRGKGAGFDLDAEVFAPLEMDPASQDKAGITLSQFAIRTEEHNRTSLSLLERIYTGGGYSPQSFGMQGDGAAEKTATEVSAHTDRSDRTTSRKRRYWGPAVEDEAEIILILDRAIFGSGVTPMRPRIEWGDDSEADLVTVSTAVEMVNRAAAASIQTRVRMLHPDWDETEVKAEAEQIGAEMGLSTSPDPADGFPV